MNFEEWFGEDYGSPNDAWERAIKRNMKAAWQASRAAAIAEIVEMIPTSWLDPLLTGEDKVIKNQPPNNMDVERLLLAIKDRIQRMGEGE